MQINVYCIQKIDESSDVGEFKKMISRWAKVSEINKFNTQISRAQKSSRNLSLRAYEEAYHANVSGFCVGLDERGERLDSAGFAKLLQDKNEINFFIGGAYGLSDEFKGKMSRVISLSAMTFSHKIAKLMLYEQIFRALCINNNHPYHK